MKDDLINEIKLHFSSSREGIRSINNINDGETFTVKESNRYGVGIINKNNVVINEKFSNVSLKNVKYLFNNQEIEILLLSSTLFSHRLEFAYLCAQFVELGKQNENRNSVIESPLEWWTKWQELLGNSISNKTVYSVIAELYVWKLELENKKKSLWMGPETASHDIQSDTYNLEVKSTLSKYKNEITISGQFQLINNSKLFIVYVKMEEVVHGMSINSLVSELVKLGENEDSINKKLIKLGYEMGASIRDTAQFRINEIRYYPVDEEFPQITPDSFVGGIVPKGIKKIVYTVDLEGLEYDKWYS